MSAGSDRRFWDPHANSDVSQFKPIVHASFSGPNDLNKALTKSGRSSSVVQTSQSVSVVQEELKKLRRRRNTLADTIQKSKETRRQLGLYSKDLKKEPISPSQAPSNLPPSELNAPKSDISPAPSPFWQGGVLNSKDSNTTDQEKAAQSSQTLTLNHLQQRFSDSDLFDANISRLNVFCDDGTKIEDIELKNDDTGDATLSSTREGLKSVVSNTSKYSKTPNSLASLIPTTASTSTIDRIHYDISKPKIVTKTSTTSPVEEALKKQNQKRKKRVTRKEIIALNEMSKAKEIPMVIEKEATTGPPRRSPDTELKSIEAVPTTCINQTLPSSQTTIANSTTATSVVTSSSRSNITSTSQFDNSALYQCLNIPVIPSAQSVTTTKDQQSNSTSTFSRSAASKENERPWNQKPKTFTATGGRDLPPRWAAARERDNAPQRRRHSIAAPPERVHQAPPTWFDILKADAFAAVEEMRKKQTLASRRSTISEPPSALNISFDSSAADSISRISMSPSGADTSVGAGVGTSVLGSNNGSFRAGLGPSRYLNHRRSLVIL